MLQGGCRRCILRAPKSYHVDQYTRSHVQRYGQAYSGFSATRFVSTSHAAYHYWGNFVRGY